MNGIGRASTRWFKFMVLPSAIRAPAQRPGVLINRSGDLPAQCRNWRKLPFSAVSASRAPSLGPFSGFDFGFLRVFLRVLRASASSTPLLLAPASPGLGAVGGNRFPHIG